MKATAAVCRVQGEPLSIEAIDVREPQHAEVRVQIEFCAICHSDITYAEGGWGGQVPAIYGHEASGVVESVGIGVTDLNVGDRVVVGLLRSCGGCYHCVRNEDHLCRGQFPDDTPFRDDNGLPIVRGLNTGAFASATVVHRSQVALIPDDVPSDAASLLACGVLTGYGSVITTADMAEGATVAVIGLGGVGLSALQAAVDRKASRLIAVDILDSKLEVARRYGADILVNARTENPVLAAREATGGIGPDYVFVTAGSAPAIEQGLAMLRRGGTIVMVGMPPTGMFTELEISNVSDAGQTILGSKMGSGSFARDLPLLIERFRAGALDLASMVSNVYPIEEINEAIAEVNAGSVVRNVIEMPTAQ
ncbi:MAG: zinc-binding dehydrogenase [Acidimicrobiia bacterium]|nr:zinc-binding dehydrogenase [Acidimicrobiia bacterium]